MNNYFTNQRVHWCNFSPDDIMFKSNHLTKKLMPEANVLSYSTKMNRDDQMALKSGAKIAKNNWGGSVYQNNSHHAVHVKLTDVKRDYVGADVDFIDLRERKDSQGGHWSGLNILVYISSFHNKFKWQNTGAKGHTNWQQVKTNSVPLPDDEGYRIAYGGQGDSNPMEHRELIEVIDIAESVRKFLVDMVLPLKRGELEKKALTLVA